MKKNLLQNISIKLVAAFISIALLITGVCYLGIEGNVVQAAAQENAVTANGEGYYVKDFTGAQFNTYKKEGTYPKLVTKTDDDVQEWLFAGWYQDKDTTNRTCTNAYASATTSVDEDATVYAKFVPANVMAVKCQVTPETDGDSKKTNMRLISTTDSADYTKMGFKVIYKGRELDCYTTTVYKRVAASDDGMECNYSANAFDKAANYFFAVRLTNITNANFTEPFYIEPYWVTADGTTVTGVSRYARVEDSYEKIVNLPVRLYSDEKVTNGEVSLSYNATQFDIYGVDGLTQIAGTVFDKVSYTEPVVDAETNMATIKLIGSNTAVDDVTPAVTADGIFANVRLQLKKDQLIESNTSFKVEDEAFENVNSENSSVILDVANVIYKNYAMDYTGGYDTSWYDEFAEEDEFVISTAADLYGLAQIVNDTSGKYKDEYFSGKTIIVGADITLNEGTPFGVDGIEGTSDDWSEVAPANEWVPIGSSATDTNYKGAFAGNFDGRENTISGLYVKNTTGELNTGMFRNLQKGCTVKDFKLMDSYIESTGSRVGSVVGDCRGNIESVYTNAIVKTHAQAGGGIVGAALFVSNASANITINNCWFDGHLIGADNVSRRLGGIVGISGTSSPGNKTLEIKNCLVTGTITRKGTVSSTNYLNIGGFIADNNGGTPNLKITNSLCTATFEKEDTVCVGAMIGFWNKGSITLSNAWVDDDVCDVLLSEKPDTASIKLPSNSSEYGFIDKDNYKGHKAYKVNQDFLDYYTYSNQTGAWVVTEDGIPALKSFCDEWIDVAWYYDHVTDKSDTFVIHTAEELYGLSKLSQDINFSGDTVKLAADIEMNVGNADSWYTKTTTPKRVFQPIGENKTFAGTFDGEYDEKIHTITGLYTYGTDEKDINGVGMFSKVSGTVSNFKLKNSYIVNKNKKYYVGAVVGQLNNGNIHNVYTDAIVNVNSKEYSGGIVGRYDGTLGNEKTISNCWFEGEIYNGHRHVGGIVGHATTGTLRIQDCISNGVVRSTYSSSKYGAYVGGIVGSVHNASAGKVSVKIENCLNTSTVSGKADLGTIGSVLGKAYLNPITMINVYTTKSVGGSVTGVGTTDNNASMTGEPILLTDEELVGEYAYIYTDFDYENTWGVVKDGTPVLRSLYDGMVEENLTAQRISTNWYYNNTSYDSSLENETTEFEIQDGADLFGLARLVNKAKVSNGFANKRIQLAKDGDFNLSPTKDFKVTADGDGRVTLDGTVAYWTPIGTSTNPFQGTFDGQNQTISSVWVRTTSNYGGLFGKATNATICNLRIDNSYINVRGSKSYFGGVAGYVTDSTLKNIYCSASITHTWNPAHMGIGGLVGYYDITKEDTNQNAHVINCWFDGTIFTDCRFVGGLIGRVQLGAVKIENSLNSGLINNSNSNTSNSAYVGGFVGGVSSDNNKAVSLIIKNCLQAGTVKVHETTLSDTTDDSVGGVVGKAANGNITFEQVYTTASLGEKEVITGLGGVAESLLITGAPIHIETIENLYGYGARELTELPFTAEEGLNYWVCRENNSPIPSTFDDVVDDELPDVVAKANTSWYYGHEDEETYTLTNIEELYGLAIVSKTYNFAGKTVYLGNDIKVNDNERLNSTWTAAVWDKKEESALLPWLQIGSNSDNGRFAGTFDGQNYTISGLYMKQNTKSMGLFAAIDENALIQNLRLENSFFHQTGTSEGNYIGSIVSDCYGSLKNVYSDAYIVSNHKFVGGIIGCAKGDSGETLSLDDVWYAGTIKLGSKGTYTGGIVGNIGQGKWKVNNCIFDGTIDCAHTCTKESSHFIGGITGAIGNKSDETQATVDMDSIISAGTIDLGGNCFSGAIVEKVFAFVSAEGDVKPSSLTISNGFITRESGVRIYNSIAKEQGTGDYANVTATPTITMEQPVVRVHNGDRFVGYCKEEDGAELDFTSDNGWVIRNAGVPVPKTFSDVVTVTDISEQKLEKEIGLTYWNKNVSLASAINEGAGNYVIRFEGTNKTQYEDYIALLGKTIEENGYGFQWFADNASGLGQDGVYNAIYTKADGDWVLNVLHVEATGVTSITISTNDDYLSPNLKPLENETKTGSVELGMLKLTADTTSTGGVEYQFGNSFVFKLPTGHFIINDGGDSGDAEGLLSFLKSKAGIAEDDNTKQVIIDAWVVSHPDADHFGVIRRIGSTPDLAKQFVVEAYYINETNTAATVVADSDFYRDVELQLLYMRSIKNQKGEIPMIYWFQTGQRYYFDGLRMDVIQSQEQIEVSDYAAVNYGSLIADKHNDFNTSSTSLVYTITTTEQNQRVFIGGDMNYVNMAKIMELYGTDDSGYTTSSMLSDIDVFVAPHHGKNTSMSLNDENKKNIFTNYLTQGGTNQFDVTLFPCSLIYGVDLNEPYKIYPYAGTANEYLKSCTKDKQYYHYGKGNVTLTFGDSITVNAPYSN